MKKQNDITIMNETKWVKDKFLKWLPNGSFYVKLSDRYQSGLPDFLVIKDGEQKFFELKAWDKEPTPIQQNVAKRIIAAGGKVFLFKAAKQGNNVIVDCKPLTFQEKKHEVA